ncbi:factor-independent urate hydroxylase [Paenibacillus sp. MMS18-CY102]|uniref:factor-independent urate hydroxylase n=1 Tax=Paenibacillus sp. MMS18-CY102 TaxID=2682849 RepID=UPI001365D41F|nr:urate oxidase [Paenibacillus sp. MMS18-CY102]MWC28713.1 urate oxidase [Paenibacillus sp. MMS18-CY102]
MAPQFTERTLMYGKGDVFVYRTYAKPLMGVKPIPESAYTGDSNVIFAWNVDVALGGEPFRTSFTEGDNGLVVATDSMKNFILWHAAEFDGCTIESFLHQMATRFMNRYGHIDTIELGAERLHFDAASVGGAGGVAPSDIVFRHARNEQATARIAIHRGQVGGEPSVTFLEGGLRGIQLIKVKGSAFAGFIRDEYTTLPETSDRPLYIHLNLTWAYLNVDDAISDDPARYVPAPQIGDVVQSVFHEVYSPSIQYLLHQIGLRVLERFPQLAAVSFESNNRTWETIVEQAASAGAVFTEPRPPYGFQRYTLTRSDADEHWQNHDARIRPASQ